MITILQHDRREWQRMAQDAYRSGHNAYGHRFSVAAATWPERVPTTTFDALQHVYRAWLVSGWRDIPALP